MNTPNDEKILIVITDAFIQKVAMDKYGEPLTGEEVDDIRLEITANLWEHIKGSIKEVQDYNELVKKSRDVLDLARMFSVEKPQL